MEEGAGRVGTHDARAARDVEIYRAVFEVNSAVKLLIDPASGTIVDANEAASLFYGYAKTCLRGMSIAELNVLPLPQIHEEMENARTERRTFFRFKHRVASGEVRDVEVHSGPFAWNGRTLLLSIIHDVTERYRLEDKLVQAQRLEAMGRLAGGVAHDFNNLLTVILAFSESIADGSRTGERAQVAATHVVQAARRAADLTQKLLTFGSQRIENPVRVDLNALLRDLDGVLREMAGEHASLAYVLDPDLANVYADPGPMVQVVTNLVRNAGEAISGAGRVHVVTRNATEDGRAWVELAVQDDGPGIPREALSHIFEPFFSTKQRGSGLGLATVYGIVQQAGGHISVTSDPGRTVFTVRLPRDDAAAPQISLLPLTVTRNALRVLIAEDDDDVRRALAEQLTTRGHTVTCAFDGEDAFGQFVSRGGAFDVLVTDVRMPRMHGHALATALRARSPHLPVVFVTGHDAGLLDADANERPYTRVLVKPCSGEALDQAIAAVFIESRAAVVA